MATQVQIDGLRRLIDDDDAEAFDDATLEAILDGVGFNTNRAASEVWAIRATRYSTLVDITESGSTRKMGDLYKNALAMRDSFDAAEAAANPPQATTRTRIGRIVRSR